MRIMADHDVLGAVAVLKRILTLTEWAAYTVPLDMRFTEFSAVGLSENAPDRVVWQTCQDRGILLVTGNRTGGHGSLDEVIHELGTDSHLPVLTIANAARVLIDPRYAESCALDLLDYMERIESLRGTGRLFVPQ